MKERRERNGERKRGERVREREREREERERHNRLGMHRKRRAERDSKKRRGEAKYVYYLFEIFRNKKMNRDCIPTTKMIKQEKEARNMQIDSKRRKMSRQEGGGVTKNCYIS